MLQCYRNNKKKGKPEFMLQSVNNFLKKVNPKARIYIIGLLLSNDRKNCANMARITGIKDREFYARKCWQHH